MKPVRIFLYVTSAFSVSLWLTIHGNFVHRIDTEIAQRRAIL